MQARPFFLSSRIIYLLHSATGDILRPTRPAGRFIFSRYSREIRSFESARPTEPDAVRAQNLKDATFLCDFYLYQATRDFLFISFRTTDIFLH